MKLFQCQNCQQLLYFENVVCEKCGYALGYLAEENALLTLAPAQNERWMAAQAPGDAYRYCANAEQNACNWLVAADGDEDYCAACRLNHTIPNLQQDERLEQWQRLEIAKHRLVYSLLRFGLPVISKWQDAQWGLRFDFLADAPEANGVSNTVITGHADGIITLNVAEADDAKREQIRLSLGEPYRTLLGHFRHEIAHYYWMRFARSERWLADFRKHFGDERADYGEALTQHYDGPADDEWQSDFISAYAQAHPWEDWAETWAHYFHVVDTLETAYAFGVQVQPAASTDDSLSAETSFDPYRQSNLEEIIETWLPVSFAVNSINRAMGHHDLYPFIITPPVQEKMAFIHATIRSDMPEK